MKLQTRQGRRQEPGRRDEVQRVVHQSGQGSGLDQPGDDDADENEDVDRSQASSQTGAHLCLDALERVPEHHRVQPDPDQVTQQKQVNFDLREGHPENDDQKHAAEADHGVQEAGLAPARLFRGRILRGRLLGRRHRSHDIPARHLGAGSFRSTPTASRGTQSKRTRVQCSRSKTCQLVRAEAARQAAAVAWSSRQIRR